MSVWSAVTEFNLKSRDLPDAPVCSCGRRRPLVQDPDVATDGGEDLKRARFRRSQWYDRGESIPWVASVEYGVDPDDCDQDDPGEDEWRESAPYWEELLETYREWREQEELERLREQGPISFDVPD